MPCSGRDTQHHLVTRRPYWLLTNGATNACVCLLHFTSPHFTPSNRSFLLSDICSLFSCFLLVSSFLLFSWTSLLNPSQMSTFSEASWPWQPPFSVSPLSHSHSDPAAIMTIQVDEQQRISSVPWMSGSKCWPFICYNNTGNISDKLLPTWHWVGKLEQKLLHFMVSLLWL